MQSGPISKWLLYITSYLPLYVWLLLSEINWKNFSISKVVSLDFDYKVIVRLILFILILISIYELISLQRMSGSEKKKLPKDMVISPESDSLMNYIVTYFTPLISFNITDIRSIIMNTLLFLLIGLMYVGSSATYLNPVLGVFGFKVYGVTNFPDGHHIISNLSFDNLETAIQRGDIMECYRLGDGVCIVKK